MRTRTTTLGAVLALAFLVPGCGNDTEDEGYPVTVLSEYRQRYDKVRTALAESAAHLPSENPARGACGRAVTPMTVAGPDGDGDEITGNAELVMEADLMSPDVPAGREPPISLDHFTIPPDFLVRGLRITGPKGPLGSDDFKVGPDYGYGPYQYGRDPGRRLAKNLAAGLRVRYVVALRVIKYTPPGVDPVPEEVGQGAVPVGEVTVGAFVIDVKQGDVPCRFRANGQAGPSAVWTEGTAEERIYNDIRLSLESDISGMLSEIGRR